LSNFKSDTIFVTIDKRGLQQRFNELKQITINQKTKGETETMKQFKVSLQILTTLLLVLYFSGSSYSQDKPNPVTKSYYSLSPTGDAGHPMFSETPPPQKVMSPQEQEMEKQLQDARKSNNVELAQQLRSELDNLRGQTNVTLPCDPRMHFIWNIKDQTPSHDYSVSTIHTLPGQWSNSIATVATGLPGAGNLWYVTPQYGNNTADTVKFFMSSNNGVSWNYTGALWFSFNHDFHSDELCVNGR